MHITQLICFILTKYGSWITESRFFKYWLQLMRLVSLIRKILLFLLENIMKATTTNKQAKFILFLIHRNYINAFFISQKIKMFSLPNRLSLKKYIFQFWTVHCWYHLVHIINILIISYIFFHENPLLLPKPWMS